MNAAISYFLYLSLSAISIIAFNVSASENCAIDHTDLRVTVEQVVDGDTLDVRPNRNKAARPFRIRLIGVNAPELTRDEKPAQVLAHAARDQLISLIRKHHNTLLLRFDQQANDHYGRRLAHAFLDNGKNIQAWLIEQGLASHIAIPPNLWQLDCYHRTQLRAQNQRMGIWNEARFQPVSTADISASMAGFRLIKGRVSAIQHTHKSVWIHFGKTFSVRIARSDLHHFDPRELQRLPGKDIIVSGWIHRHNNKPQMRVRHPSNLKKTADYSLKTPNSNAIIAIIPVQAAIA